MMSTTYPSSPLKALPHVGDRPRPNFTGVRSVLPARATTCRRPNTQPTRSISVTGRPPELLRVTIARDGGPRECAAKVNRQS
jgi:hypothetical protein